MTIDGKDAKDFDDAVFVEPDKKNKDHWHLIVAIVDVSHYVKRNSVLDKEALTRGDSTYFPDQVIPMFPEALSNDLCSLKPLEDRACLAVHLYINEKGELQSYKFLRALMNSHAHLTYQRAQKIYEEAGKKSTNLYPAIKNLYAAYDALKSHRQDRQALESDLLEPVLKLNKHYQVLNIEKTTRLDSHQLIEEFMIAANVAAAKFMQKHALEFANIFRIHEEPSLLKLENLAQILKQYNFELPKADLNKSKTFNKILTDSNTSEHKNVIHPAVLRSQSQAVYQVENLGHFDLSLLDYTHFTSPIRRYADLCIHRKINAILEKQLEVINEEKMIEIAEHISATERVSIKAERATIDRYVASFMRKNIGQTVGSTISAVTGFGMFLTIAGTGADAMIPFRLLKHAFFIYDQEKKILTGERTGETYKTGDLLEPVQSLLTNKAIKASVII